MTQTINASEQKDWWLAIFSDLAGASPSAYLKCDEQSAYTEREAMKFAASNELRKHKEPAPASFHAPWWLLIAYAHWWRAKNALDRMDSAKFNLAFECEMSFRRYLGAWLWSVGVPQLSMTANDLHSIHECTGVAPLPHPLLPRGHSEFLTNCFATTEVDRIPAKNLVLETVLYALHKSQMPDI